MIYKMTFLPLPQSSKCDTKDSAKASRDAWIVRKNPNPLIAQFWRASDMITRFFFSYLKAELPIFFLFN